MLYVPNVVKIKTATNRIATFTSALTLDSLLSRLPDAGKVTDARIALVQHRCAGAPEGRADRQGLIVTSANRALWAGLSQTVVLQ